MLHGAGISTYIETPKWPSFVGKYSSTMEHLGYIPAKSIVSFYWWMYILPLIGEDYKRFKSPVSHLWNMHMVYDLN
jgi:hypothetical protein